MIGDNDSYCSTARDGFLPTAGWLVADRYLNSSKPDSLDNPKGEKVKRRYTILWCALLIVGVALFIAWSLNIAGTRAWLCFGAAAMLVCGSGMALGTPRAQSPSCKYQGANFATDAREIGSLRPRKIGVNGVFLERWARCNSCAHVFVFAADTEPLHP